VCQSHRTLGLRWCVRWSTTAWTATTRVWSSQSTCRWALVLLAAVLQSLPQSCWLCACLPLQG
jgi:hypothetical protein